MGQKPRVGTERTGPHSALLKAWGPRTLNQGGKTRELTWSSSKQGWSGRVLAPSEDRQHPVSPRAERGWSGRADLLPEDPAGHAALSSNPERERPRQSELHSPWPSGCPLCDRQPQEGPLQWRDRAALSLIPTSTGEDVKDRSGGQTEKKAPKYRNILTCPHVKLAMLYFEKTWGSQWEQKPKAFRSTSVWAGRSAPGFSPAHHRMAEDAAGQPHRWPWAQPAMGQARCSRASAPRKASATWEGTPQVRTVEHRDV